MGKNKERKINNQNKQKEKMNQRNKSKAWFIIIIHFIYRRLQLLVKNILIQIDKEIHSYH